MDLFPIETNPVPEGALVGEIAASDGVRLRTAHWRPTARKTLGTVCIFQGRAESIERYFETVGDLRRRGFAVATSLLMHHSQLTDLELCGPSVPRCREILSPDALEFVAGLARAFRPRIDQLLADRQRRHRRLAQGEPLGFLAETRGVREGDWRVAPLPADLLRRTVEITGPVDRKMIINALNSRARAFMADFEDSCAPTWENVARGQVNLRDAVRRTIALDDPATGKRYRLNERTATLIVRPRGWHLPEKHVLVDGEPVSGAIFDFAVFLANNHAELAARGTGPYFYLPKMESHHEARLWNEIFLAAQDRLDIPRGTIKATVLIETVLAAF